MSGSAKDYLDQAEDLIGDGFDKTEELIKK